MGLKINNLPIYFLYIIKNNYKYMDEKLIIDIYLNSELSCRDIAKKFDTNHKKISKLLKDNNIKIIRKKHKPFTDDHRNNISKSCKGRQGWNKGLEMPIEYKLKNMVAKLKRPLVNFEMLKKYDNYEKLKFLNKVISRHRKHFDDIKYINYLEKFYYDKKFNLIYNKWIETNKNKWFMPSIDHINPKSNGGNFDLDNLRFITWFENRTKSDIDLDTWENIKENINDYFI